jgi:hypothetical protein
VKNVKNTILKLLKVNASIWFNKQCQAHHVTPKYAQIHLKVDVILTTNHRGDHHAALDYRILRLETDFLQHLPRQKSENQLMCWEFNSCNGTHCRWPQRAPKRAGVLVNQRDLVYER